MSFRGLMWGLVAIGAVCVCAAPVVRAESVLARTEAERMVLFQKVAKAVVFLSNDNGFGSGFFVSADGLILTNAHVVGEAESVQVVLQDGRTVPGDVIERAPDIDLATVRVALDDTPWLAESRRVPLAIGMFVASVGHGRGAIWTFNTGIISNIYPRDAERAIFQTQIPLNPGNSGGPVVDRDSRVAGIVVAGLTDSNSINFAFRYSKALTSLPSLAAICRCLIVHTPGAEPIFVDGQMVGHGPRLGLRLEEGAHQVFAVTDGKMVKKSFRFPETKTIELEAP